MEKIRLLRVASANTNMTAAAIQPVRPISLIRSNARRLRQQRQQVQEIRQIPAPLPG